MRLCETMQDDALKEYPITLERVRPPTLERLGLLLANTQHRIVHFMGHGGQHEKEGAILCFETENGDLNPVTAKDFMRQVSGSVFLVTLNACVSATPGETHLSNLAAELVRQKTPYALGMRFSIPDEEALTFSRTFYSYLARASSVEEAVYRVRLALARNRHRQWMIGMPVLYTALSAPTPGFASRQGTPEIKDPQMQIHIEVSLLPRAEGTFQGRADDVKLLGTALTGDTRRRIFTIHGSGGQGQTTLPREAIERFAYAWPGGVWATSLEKLPNREVFTNDLAHFLGITIDPTSTPAQVEQQVLAHLNKRRTLIVLDNAETLVDAVEARDASAIHLAQILKQLPGPTVSLLVTSRVQLGWPEEVSLELSGLSPDEGAALFQQSSPQRTEAIDKVLAQQLSKKIDGHPFSLRLLGGAFNASTIDLLTFLSEHEAQLVKAENKYVGEHHRQRTLYANIETSVRYLDKEHRHLLSGLWLFHTPFLPETAAEIFDPQVENTGEGERTGSKRSPIYDRLYTLWRRGLLIRETVILREGTLLLYRLPPTMRPYIEQFLAQADERETLLARFGAAYAGLVRFLYRELDRGSVAAATALLLREDLERGVFCVTGVEQGYYLLRWGWTLQRLGIERQHGLELTEKALEIGQEQDQQLKLQALNNMAEVYRGIGQPQQALKLFEQALPIRREVGDRAGEATTLSSMAMVYAAAGQFHEALKVYDQALPIIREVGDRAGEATILASMAYLYQTMQQYPEARAAFEQSIALAQQVSHRAGEVAGLVGLALLLYQYLDRPQEAITRMERALEVLIETGLPQDAAGNTKEDLQQYLNAMRQGIPFGQTTNTPAKMPDATLQQIVTNTVAVMTVTQDRHVEWREVIAKALQDAQQRGEDWQIEADFFSAVLDILDGKSSGMPGDHPYAQSVTVIQEGIAAGRSGTIGIPDEIVQAVRDFVNAENWDVTRQVIETRQAVLFRP